MLETVTRDQVVRYLKWRGWRESALEGRRILLYTHEEKRDDAGDLIELAIPAIETSDIQSRIAQLVESLAAVEGRSIQEVAGSIESSDRDIQYLKLADNSQFRRGIPLQSAPDVINSLRDLVAHSAANVAAPCIYHPRMTEAGKKHAERCVFGHTFRGSYGFTVETPLPLPLLRPEELEAPFERRVSERIAAGIGYLADAAASQRLEILYEHQDEGLNSNMCEALLEIGEIFHGAPTTYTIAWSPEWPVAPDLAEYRPIKIDEKAYRCLGSYIREVRPAEEPTEVTVAGRVVILRSDDPPMLADDSAREIVIATNIEGRAVNVHVSLSGEDYRSACDAHLAGSVVSVTGTLEKRGKYWTLVRPKSFAIGAGRDQVQSQ